MPDLVEILVVEPRRSGRRRRWPEVGESLASDALSTLVDHVDSDVRVLFASPWDATSFGALIRSGGSTGEHWSVLSVSPPGRKLRQTKGTAAPLTLTIDADPFVDLLSEVAGRDDPAGARENQLSLPGSFPQPDRLLLALQFLAPLVDGTQVRVVRIGSGFGEVTLNPAKGVRLVPLFVRFEDEGASALAQGLFSAPPSTTWLPPLSGSRAAVRGDELIEAGDRLGELLADLVSGRPHGASPLTSGSASSRRRAAWAESVTGAQLIEAVSSQHNAGTRFDEVRGDMYARLARRFPASAVEPLVVALRSEPPQVRAIIHEALSWIDAPTAARPLVEAFLGDQPGPERDRTGRFVWRQRAGVELLVRRLIELWPNDQLKARRVLTLIESEYLGIERSWLEGAPAELKTRLDPFVSKPET